MQLYQTSTYSYNMFNFICVYFITNFFGGLGHSFKNNVDVTVTYSPYQIKQLSTKTQ
jgi:hypothetical protein